MQALAQAGSTQCMHCAFMNETFVALLVELDDVLRLAVEVEGRVVQPVEAACRAARSLASRQATTQALQPMHFVVS